MESTGDVGYAKTNTSNTVKGHSSVGTSIDLSANGKSTLSNGDIITSEVHGKQSASAYATIGDATMKTINSTAGVLSTLASLLFGTMWSAIILATVSAATGILAFHKAGTLRRDEIIDELRKSKKGSK